MSINTTTEIVQCTICQTELNEEERDAPYYGDGDNVICDTCFDWHYSFTCPNCEESEHIKYQGAIGSLFVATDEDALGIPDGMYQVIEHPFYADGIIEASLYTDAIKQVSDDTFGITDDHYPMAFLCQECEKDVRLKMAEGEDG